MNRNDFLNNITVVISNANNPRTDFVLESPIKETVLTFRVKLDNDKYGIINSTLLKSLNIAVEEIAANAKIDEMDISDFFGMHYVTNANKMYGANVILDENNRNEINRRFGKVWLLPSSIHEWIVLPYNDFSYDTLKEMIISVNKSDVSEDEVLSDRPYILDRGKIYV